eukprot:g5505.t1
MSFENLSVNGTFISERGENAPTQCLEDCKQIRRKHGRTIFIGGVAAIAGILLCLLLTPEPHLMDQIRVHSSQVAKWVSDSNAAGLQLASSACPDGGLAQMVKWNNTSGDFEIECESPRLSRRAFFTLGLTLTTLALMMAGQPPDICMLVCTLALLLWPWADSPGEGIISEDDAWQGFSNKGVLTVGALFVTARAVDETGIVSLIMKRVLGKPKSLFVAQLRLLIPVAVASAFMNNTPIVAMLIPVVETWAPKIGHSPSKFLMPLSFASMLGGMCSMMGTSTNLVVAGLLTKKNPEMKPFGLFDIAPVGAPCALLGIVYMSVCSKYLLPSPGMKASDGGAAIEDDIESDQMAENARSYLIYFVCDKTHGESRQSSTAEVGVAGLSMAKDGACLVQVLRGGDGTAEVGRTGTSRWGVGDNTRLASMDIRIEASTTGLPGQDPESLSTATLSAGDILALRCRATAMGALRRSLARQGVRLLSELPTPSSGRAQGRRRNCRYLAEAVVGRDSPVLGLPRDIDGEVGEVMLERYGASLVGIRDDGVFDRAAPSSMQAKLLSRDMNGEDRTLDVGNVLLLEVFPRSFDLISSEFTLITAVPGSRPPRTGTAMDRIRMYVAGFSLTAMVLLSALKFISLLTGALLASAVMLACKTITLKTALSAVKGRTLLAIVTTFGVGTAFEVTGLAHWIAQGLTGIFGSLGPLGVLLSVSLVTSIVGCAVSNNAVVILMYPICATLANEVEGVSLRQLLVVLLVGASSSFLTPMSYQTNLMVFTPGKYKFSDYFKFGVTLQLLMIASSVTLAYMVGDIYK